MKLGLFKIFLNCSNTFSCVPSSSALRMVSYTLQHILKTQSALAQLSKPPDSGSIYPAAPDLLR